MRARRRLIGALGAALLAGCAGVPTSADWDNDPECDANTPPEIGNLVLNSAFFPDDLAWGMCISFQWLDPGRDEAGNVGSDPQNLFGGFFSSEFQGVDTLSVWIDEGAVDPAASSGSLQVNMVGEGLAVELEAIAQWLPVDGEPPPDWSLCPDLNGNGTADLSDCVGGRTMAFAMRLRDRCDDPSNELTGEYQLGSDRRVEADGLTGCEVVQAPSGGEAR